MFMSELSASEEKIKKAIAGQIEKTIEELHTGYLLELEQTREKLAEDYEAFTTTLDKTYEDLMAQTRANEKRIADLEANKPSGFLFESFIPLKNRVRFMDGQRAAAAGFAASKSTRQVQKIAIRAAAGLVDCMELEDKAPRVFVLDKYEIAGVMLGGMIAGAAGITALAMAASHNQLKKHGRTAADLDAWLKRKPIVTEGEVADNVVQLEPARAAAMSRVK
jgi:hypothetical protein